MSTVGLCLFVAAGLGPAGPLLVAAQYSNVYQLIEPYVHPYLTSRPHHNWINSGKFQGDIAGIDAALLREPDGMVFYNALKNKQLAWKDGIIPYEMDPAFLPHEVKIIEKAFASYRKSTCIRFQSRNGEQDYLNIVKGFGCYSQVGRTGGKQEISLGRGCLFHEIIVHELMHSVGFWHEHSR
ncbi:astacin, partial [Ostertagia ostertagi]